MKLVLASTGEGKAIEEKVAELVGKGAGKINIMVLDEASAAETWDIRWLIDGLNHLQKTYGEIYGCNLLSLDMAEIQERINKVDVIWCFGGHTDFLMGVFNKSGFAKLLPKILENKVWVGSSAGACVMGVRPKTKLDSDKYIVDKYMELANLTIRPHIWADYAAPGAYDECVQESKINNIPVYALSDDSAVVVEGGRVYMIGKRAQKLVGGKVVEEI